MTSPSLFDPVQMGALTLPNRVLMAPLTRNRAQGDGTPKAMAQTYYRQRASAGLIITEATQVSAMGKGYIDTPGIHEAAHQAAWREITQAVHGGGGRIFAQLWHVGRISHSSLLPDGAQPVSSSARAANAQTVTADGFVDCSPPVALDKAGITATVADFVTGAKTALAAGFDGVEIHAANGYLLDQFLRDGVNDRTDEYGGSAENRSRLLFDIIEAVSAVFPRDRIGVRLSPLAQFNDMGDSDPEALFGYVYERLNGLNLAYLHVVEKFPGSEMSAEDEALMARLRPKYTGFYIANGDYSKERAEQAIAGGHADAVTFGRPFIANPDLPERFRVDAPLNEPNPDTFYGGNEAGYTDYPTLVAA